MTPSDTSRQLVDRCRRGDRGAQRELFDRTSGPIYRLLLRMTGNREDAFDLAQDTYVKGLSKIGEFDGRSDVATWFYRIAVNEALQWRRRERTGAAKLRDLATHASDHAEDAGAELRLDVGDALAELPPDDRAVLLLRYQEGLDYGMIADVLQCAGGTVASRLHRARDRLREMLRKSYG